jgi:hypothetical protein
MPATVPPSLEDLAKYPTMTRWFRPGLLAKLLWRVVVSELFGQYADRRLIVAALDTVSDDELIERAQQFAPGSGNEDCTLTPDPEGAVWIDYVADLGDGFDATYAIASLLAQETLTIAGHVTRRGQILMSEGSCESYLSRGQLAGVMALMQKPQRLKRSVVVSGRRTAISLEDAFADGLREIAAERGVTMSALVSMIDTSRTQSNLSSRGNGPKQLVSKT